MRLNCRVALEGFLRGVARKPAPSIWTDGESLWSYSTILATRLAEGVVALNVTRYSVTTSIHQNALRWALPNAVQVDGLAQGANAEKLRAHADETLLAVLC